MRKRNFVVAGIGAALVSVTGLVGTASADIAQFTSAAFSGRSSFTPSLMQFDPSLGTLTGVEIDLTMDLTPIATVINISGSSVPFTDAFTNTTGVNPPGDPSGTHSPVTWSAYSQTASADYSYDLSTGGVANPGENEFDGPAVPESSSTIILSTNFADFEGVGSTNVPYTVGGDTNSGGSPGFPLFYGGDRQFDGTATVTYTYIPSVGSPAPEPASLTLAGMGMLLLMRRRSAR